MISIIAAVANGGVIGGENRLLWHITEDLKRFKAITSGHPVVMGRKTYESIGKPLPGRTNVVITRNPGFVAEGCIAVGSLEEAVSMFPDPEEVFIIGGGEIYRQAMHMADRLYITWVRADYEGDTLFPDIDNREWRIVSIEHYECGDKFGHPFDFADYERAVK